MSALIEASGKDEAIVPRTLENHPSHSALTSFFGAVKVEALLRLGLQQISQVLQSAHRCYCVYDTDGRVGEVLKDLFNHRSCRFTYINAGTHSQLLVFDASTGKQGSLVLKPSPSFET